MNTCAYILAPGVICGQPAAWRPEMGGVTLGYMCEQHTPAALRVLVEAWTRFAEQQKGQRPE